MAGISGRTNSHNGTSENSASSLQSRESGPHVRPAKPDPATSDSDAIYWKGTGTAGHDMSGLVRSNSAQYVVWQSDTADRATPCKIGRVWSGERRQPRP
jgi:hypothetical protein